jgi:hypothetical protein
MEQTCDSQGVPNPGSRGREVKMRPSTLLRIERLGALVAAFSARDLGPAGIATLLRCSGSCARNYVTELVDAGVVKPMPGDRSEACVDKNVYRLNPNRRLVDAFLASLEAYRPDALTRATHIAGHHDRHCGASAPDPLAACGNRSAAKMVARRDPLVTALFGAPGKDNRGQTWRRVGREEASPSLPRLGQRFGWK